MGVLTIKPSDGGQLITRADATEAGVAHYIEKVNWRRDLTDEMRREGHDYWVPDPTADDAQIAAFTQPLLPASAKITLIHVVRRPNGEAVVIVGTQTTLYRFNLSLLGYFENPLTGLGGGDTDPTTYAEGLDGEPYVEAGSRWQTIGSGFSANGRRWEAVDINGTTVLNNGVDLPVAYRVEWREVRPLYELREQGVVCVGTIAASNGILLCCDVTELQDTDWDQVLKPVRSGAVTVVQAGHKKSGTISAYSTGTTITASSSIFAATDKDRTLLWWNGERQVITGYTSGTVITAVAGTARLEVDATTFWVTDQPKEFYNRSSGAVTATSTTTIVTASASFFVAGDEGRDLVWADGSRRRITHYTSGTEVTVATGAAVAAPSGFRIAGASQAAFEIVASADLFTDAILGFDADDLVGMKIGWADGQWRRVVEVVDARTVMTDCAEPVTSGEAWIENPLAYAGKEALEAALPSIQFNQYQWRLVGGEIGEAERFGILLEGQAVAESRLIEVDMDVHSFATGDEVMVAGAGTDGGVLQRDANNRAVTVVGVGPGFVHISTPAIIGGTVTIQRQNTTGSYQYDLQEDGAGILKAMKLQNRVAIYTDSNIFLGRYTGDLNTPWEWELITVPHGRSLHYRNTLTCVNGMTHIYAGKNAFYQFDLTSRLPQPIAGADLVSNLFFDYASLDDTESIFAGDNHLTHEVWMVCPDNTANPVLCYDYVYGTFSTMDWAPTACPTVKEVMKPIVGATPDWFLMGTEDGVVLQYGLSTEAVVFWTNAKNLWYRRSTRTYTATKSDYTSTLKGGLNALGDEYNEKVLRGYAVRLSSRQPTLPAPGLVVTFYSAVNPNATVVEEGSKTITDLAVQGKVDLAFVTYYAQDKMVASGEYPIRMHSRTWEGKGVRSGSYGKT